MVNKNPWMKHLKIGNVIELTWTDVQGYSRLNGEDIDNIQDPLPTITWGVVVKVLPGSVVLAHEICDPTSDGCFASIYPFKIIDKVKLLGSIKIQRDE